MSRGNEGGGGGGPFPHQADDQGEEYGGGIEQSAQIHDVDDVVHQHGNGQGDRYGGNADYADGGVVVKARETARL